MNTLKNEKAAEIVGLSMGDGSLTKRKSGKLRYQMRGNQEEREFYDDHVKPLFEQTVGHVSTTHYEGKKPYYGICSETQKLCTTLTYLGIPVGVKNELIIPSWIKEDRKRLMRFIRGFVDTDGSVFCGRDYNYPEKKHVKLRMSVISTSQTLIKELSESLKKLGIHNLIIKPYSSNNPKWRKMHKIQIDGPNVISYFKLIGSKNQKHITKFLIWKKYGFCPALTSLRERQAVLKGQLQPESFYAGVAEPGQMRKSAISGA